MLDIKNLPEHLAFIIDGNGRWAVQRGLQRLEGHKEGVEAVKRTIKSASNYGIKIVSFFAFSTENWKRNKQEVDGIFDLFRKYFDEYKDEFIKNEIKVQTMGDLTKLPKNLQNSINEVKQLTKKFTKMIVNIGLNYGSKSELVRAVNNILQKGKKHITEKDLEKELYTSNLPNPDMIIRTSGEQRLSNFMLYQAAYSELYFPKTFWPEFDEKHFEEVLKEYSQRQRRYGAV